MNILEPNIKHRYSVEDVLSSYENAEAAFLAGNYVAALRLCDFEQDRELAGCAYIMAGYAKKGIEILEDISVLSDRGLFYFAFGYWVEDDKKRAINIIDGLCQTHPDNELYFKFKSLLAKQRINLLLFGHLQKGSVQLLFDSIKYAKETEFNVKTVGYSKAADIRIQHDSDILQVLSLLPDDEYPDFALFISPYGIFHKNYQDLPIPKLIFLLDHDYFTYNYGGIIKNDIVVTTGPIEHFEITHFYSLPCHTYYSYDASSPKIKDTTKKSEEESNKSLLTPSNNVAQSSSVEDSHCHTTLPTDPAVNHLVHQTKKYDFVLTGSIFNDFQRQKGQLVFKLIHMPNEWKIRIEDGFLDIEQYFEFLMKSKYTFTTVRFIDILQQRAVDALKNSCMSLYPQEASCALFLEHNKMKPYKEGFEELKQQLTSYLTDSIKHSEAAVSDFKALFKEPPERELCQLKYFSFLSIFKHNDINEQQRKQSLQETTGANGFESWAGHHFTDSLLPLKNYLNNISAKTEYHYIKLFNLYVYESVNKKTEEDDKKIEDRQVQLLYAHQIGREGLKRFPSSLVLRFNVARFYYFTAMTKNALSEFLRITHSASNLVYFELTADIFNFFFPKRTLSLEEEVYFPQLDYADNIIIKYMNPKMPTSLQKPYTEPKNIILSNCHYFIADIYLQQDNLQKSLNHLLHALELHPDNYIAQNLIVEVLIKTINQHNKKEVLAKVLHYYVSAVRHYPAFIRKDTFAYALQAAHFLGHQDIAVQLLNSWFLLYKRVIPTNRKLIFSKVTVTTILKYTDFYPHSLIHHFFDKHFISISTHDKESVFLLEEGEEQLIYPFFEYYLSHYVKKQDFDKVIILLGKLIDTPNLSVKRQIIHSCIHFLIAKNVHSSELQAVIEQLKNADFNMTDDEAFSCQYI
ncbi:hypothetical protein [Candidatus Albibeggiatoa sp. nov. NOAA]|uniref:tetratricopeptide repeat protein n=1 Tax=Candidatus Albibeggiatoa sp. nov. NOAA TaxID=3162724 RepID=UPI0032F881A7|nr:hypothetical protein [Thiotrichaceae bacterium]